MAYPNVLVAIMTAYLSAIAYGTLLTIPEPNSSHVFSSDTKSTPIFLSSPKTTYPLTTSSTIFSSFVTQLSSYMSTREKQKASSARATSETRPFTTSQLSTIPSTKYTTALPVKINNFTTSWRTDEDDVDYIVIVWSEQNDNEQQTGWKLNLTKGLEMQSLIIDSNCSRQGKSRQHQVKLEQLLPTRYFLTCSDGEQSNHSELVTIKSCFSYELSLVPVSGERHQLPKKTKLTAFIKWPSKIESSYDINESNLMIRWELPYENLNCSLKYRYSLNVDKVGNISETTDSRRIAFKVEQCTHYSIAVWSIGVDDSNEIVSTQPARHIGRTDTRSFNMTDMQTHARAINQTCLIVKWSMSRDIRQFIGCDVSFRIFLDPPSAVGQYQWEFRNEKQVQEEMLCHLRPATEYKVRIEVLDNRDGIQHGTRIYSPSASVQTPNRYDLTTVALIITSCLLSMLVMCVAVYCIWSRSSRHGKKLQVTEQNLRLKSSFLGHKNRRRAHPVKVRNLEEITKRLCSSAGQLLEMEFEDLTIIADSRRPKEALIASLPANGTKNRYLNVLPYEQTLVPLSLLPDRPDSDYINASYVVGFSSPKEYIATQGPKANTIGDFWRMIWQQNVYIIIMVTGLEERGKPKCDRYWPEEVETPLLCDGLSISQLDATHFENYTISSFEVKLSEESRIVKHAYLKGWADFRVPECPEILIRFVEVIRILANKRPSSPLRPIVVHCSAGVGRTGTFIAVDWLMQAARLQKEIDIFTTVLQMRQCRTNMVQSEEQYEYVYRCMSHFANTRLFSSENVEDTSDIDAENFLMTNGNKQLLNEVA